METQLKTKKGTKLEKSLVHGITPFLWFNNQAEEAVNFYISIFKNSKIKTTTRYGKEGAKAAGMPEDTLMTVSFLIERVEFTAINAGPVFSFSPAISFFVNCESRQEIEEYWEKLSRGGTVMMELDKYPFSERYGWIQDKFGVSWQLILPGRKQKIAPCLMFTGEQHLKAEEAINFYISVFKNSSIIQLERYNPGTGPEGAVVHSKFTLNNQEFIAMDSHMQLSYTFNPSISFVVNCETQEEIDYHWDKLADGGYEPAQQCGWLQDKYGVSWQIIPVALIKMLSDPDPEKSERVMHAMIQMKKIDLKAIKRAYAHR